MYYEDLDTPDAPGPTDIFEDQTHEKLMALRGGEGEINGIKIVAVFDKKIDGDNYFNYIINGKSMNFSDAYDFLIS